MSLLLFSFIYLLIGAGFAIAADENKPDVWNSLCLVLLVLFWPGVIAHAIGKMKVST